MEEIIVVWAVLIVVFLIVEGVTAGLASIWFAIGALFALISVFLGAPIWLQIIIFIIVSIIALFITRPLARKYVNSQKHATNADRVIGMTASVTERIDNVAGKGAASVGGRVWTARSATGEIIEKDTKAVIQAIEGVKLIVAPQASDVYVKAENKQR